MHPAMQIDYVQSYREQTHNKAFDARGLQLGFFRDVDVHFARACLLLLL